MKSVFQILSLAALLTLSACGAGADPAVGTWKLDATATVEGMRATMDKQMEGQPEEMKKLAAQMMDTMVAAMKGSMELKADGTATGSMTMPNPMGGEPSQSNATGTWKNENGSVSITMAEEGQDGETSSGKLEGDTLTMTEQQGGQEMKIVFKRQG